MLWYEAIQPYARNYQITFCPERPDLGPGYGMNYACSRLGMERVSSPTNLVLIADVLPEAIGAQPGWPAASARPYAWWVNDRENDLAGALYDTSYWAWGRAQVHSGGAVYGFADGHVKWAKEETLDRPEHWQPLYYGP